MPTKPSASELVEASLAAIVEHGDRTNAFILVDADGARAAAHVADEERKRGTDRGPLHGMPVSLKDLIDVAGQPTTAGSRVRAHHVAAEDAPIVTRLREAGAVIIGKTNLHEFALGPTSDESAFGPVLNPHDTTRMAGGSSGGAAAAVATGMGRFAVGSDTGGSIRIPAAACGIVGLKPSLGEVPTDGVVSLSTTYDHVGPLTRDVCDAAALWAVLADRPMPRLDNAPETITLGALGGYFTQFLSEEVHSAYDAALDQLRTNGVMITTRVLDRSETIVPTYSDISLPEAAHWHAETLASQPNDYTPGVRSRLEMGQKVPAVNYVRARAMRDVLRDIVDAALDGCDALVLPTLPIVAPTLGTTEASFGDAKLPVRAALLRLTQLFNISGHPAITLPVDAPGLPVGLQLVGHRDRTADLLAIAARCERFLA